MTDQESNELVMYNTDFQRSVLLMMCSNIAFSVNYGLLLKQAYFDLQPLRIIFGIVCDYVLRYERELDRNNLLMLIDDYTMSKSLNKDATKVLVEECKTIFNAKISSEYFVQDQVIKFVRQAELKNAILKAIMVMEKDTSGSYEEVLRLIDEAVSIGCGVNRGVTFEDLLNLPTEYRNKYSPDKLIRTGFPRYDAAMLGGLASNEIHIIMGAPKSGKSTFGANIGAHALVGGRAIYHASLEIQELDVLKNYALRLTGMTHDEFMTCDLSYYTSKLERFRKYRPKLFVNYWPEGTINAMAIRSWISRERSQTGISPEIIIVDYDDCATSGTRISGLDGTERPIEELVGMNEFWLYSCKDDGTLVPGRGHSARKVRDVSTICEIELDNGEICKFTPDHRFMMRDGTYRKAKELKPGDSLMPLYRDVNDKGYEIIRDNKTRKMVQTHQIVARNVVKKGDKLVSNYNRSWVVHHKGIENKTNKRNNDPSNLVWMGDIDHWLYHSSITREMWNNPDFRAKMIPLLQDKAKKQWQDPEFIKAVTAKAFRQWDDPVFQALQRDKSLALWDDPVYQQFIKENSSRTSKEHWQDPNYRKKMADSMAIARSDPDYKNRIKIASLASNAEVKDRVCKKCGQVMHTDAKGLLKHIASCNSVAAAADRLVIKDRYCKKCEQYICTDFGGMVSHAMQCDGTVEMPQVAVNHKVRSVKIVKLSRPEPVYDITVDKYHNFALSAGVFTHNCLVPTSGKTDDMYEDSGMIYRDLIQLSAYFKCCRGNTMIPLLDGTERRIDSFNKGDKLQVHSVNADGSIGVELAIAVGQTSVTNKIVVIGLDNSEKLELTPDHKIMLNNNFYIAAKNSCVGDKLKSLNKQITITSVNTITVKDEPMYCLYVPTTSNFAVSSGVFIHNCPLISFAQPKREAWDKPDRNELIISQDLAHCLTGDTEVLGVDGQFHRIDKFAKGEIVELYGVDESWHIKPVKAFALGIVDTVNMYYNIMLNDGTNVSCTADHKLSIADNMQFIPGKLAESYRQAKDIKVGDTITTIGWYAHDRHLSYNTVVGTMKVHTKNEPVYCFHVQETGNFMLSNGILSSNSAKKAHKAYSISSINFPKGADRGTLLVDIARRGVSNTRIPIYRDFSRALVEEV